MPDETRTVSPPSAAIAGAVAAWQRDAEHACYWCGRAMPDSRQGHLCCSSGCEAEAQEMGAL